MSLEEFLFDILSVRSPSGKEEKVAERLKEEFLSLGYDEIIEASGNVCGRRGNGPIKLLYDAHMDVVDTGGGWSDNPYTPVCKDGKIIARGAVDDKGPLAAMVYGGASADVTGITLYVIGSVREEVAAGSGLKDFFSNTGISPDCVVVGEPSRNMVTLGSRGRVLLRADFGGKAAHASDPDKGLNAVYNASHAVKAIEELNEKLRNIGDSVAVTNIKTSQTSLNIIPDFCSIWMDYRPSPGRSYKDILSSFSFISESQNLIERVSDFYMPWEIEEGHPFVGAAIQAAAFAGCPTKKNFWNFCTNASYTGGELKIPTIGFGPGDEAECHTADESIEVQEIKKAVKFFSLLPEFIQK